MSPAPSPPSLLITPDRRRRLQQQYDEARRLAAQPEADFRRIHDILAGCVAADPGNVLYVNALLANVKRWNQAVAQQRGLWGKLLGWFGKHLHTKNSTPGTPHAQLADAPNVLRWETKLDVLHGLAAAAGELDFEEVELRYLNAARERAPDDVQTLRLVARALTRQGRFEDAVGPWFAVLALAPGDHEAEQAVNDLRGATTAEGAADPATASSATANVEPQMLREQAEASRQAGQFELAEHYFTQAQAALGADLALYEVRENLRQEKSASRVEVARRRAKHDEHPRAQALVARLAEEHQRLEIEIFNLRAERLPGDPSVRLQLAHRLKAVGNYSAAVQRLEEALRLAPAEPEVLIELGECWQHLRQFAKALTYYEQAVAAVAQAEPSHGRDTWLLARYRAGVLAEALGRSDVARRHWAAIVEVEPQYKDVASRAATLPASSRA